MKFFRIFVTGLVVLTIATVCLADERVDRLKSLVETRSEAAAVAATQPKQISQPPQDGISGIRVIEGLFLTLGIFFIGVWGYQKYKGDSLPRTGGRRMKLLERITVGNKTSLVLAEIDGRSVLLSVGSERVAFFSDSAWLEGAWEKEQQESAPV